MVGSAGATMVCSSADKNIASRMPNMIARIAAWSSGAAGVAERPAVLADGGPASLIAAPPCRTAREIQPAFRQGWGVQRPYSPFVTSRRA